MATTTITHEYCVGQKVWFTFFDKSKIMLLNGKITEIRPHIGEEDKADIRYRVDYVNPSDGDRTYMVLWEDELFLNRSRALAKYEDRLNLPVEIYENYTEESDN